MRPWPPDESQTGPSPVGGIDDLNAHFVIIKLDSGPLEDPSGERYCAPAREKTVERAWFAHRTI